MITDRITALFKFIEFLHSNIKNFTQYNEIVNELQILLLEQNKLSSSKNFKDKLMYDEMQLIKEKKFEILEENIIKPLQAKANELNICDLKKPETLWNWNIGDISRLKEHFNQYDLSLIFMHKSKYLEYRTVTSCTYFQDLFFRHLDGIIKELFNYFKETQENEFEVFETKALQVNSIEEAIKGFKQGQTNYTLSFESLFSSNNKQINNSEHLPNQETYIPKPCFNPESINHITEDLNTFFDTNQHAELKRIIETGSNTNEKLLFRDNGNRLTDYFKRLIENDTITGCDKKDLINWIVENFTSIYRKTQKGFIYKTVEKTISGNEQPCKNPII